MVRGQLASQRPMFFPLHSLSFSEQDLFSRWSGWENLKQVVVLYNCLKVLHANLLPTFLHEHLGVTRWSSIFSALRSHRLFIHTHIHNIHTSVTASVTARKYPWTLGVHFYGCVVHWTLRGRSLWCVLCSTQYMSSLSSFSKVDKLALVCILL